MPTKNACREGQHVLLRHNVLHSHCTLIISHTHTHSPASCSNGSPDEHKMVKVWKPLMGASHEDESVVDGYLELVCSPAVLHAGRNKEFAMHLLHQLGGSVKVQVDRE